MQPLVTIITVSLNSIHTIEQTIRSVLQQTYHNIEYIIVDGCSTDGTCELVEKYLSEVQQRHDGMSLCLISEPDKGIYDAMNKGIRRATGDIIGIINSDDWYELDAIEKVVEMFRHNPTAGVFYGGIRLYGACDEYKGRWFPSVKDLNNTMIPHPSCFITRDYYNIYGLYDLRYMIAADYDLLARIYKHGGKFRRIKALLANFREGGASTTNTKQGYCEAKQIKEMYGLTDYVPIRTKVRCLIKGFKLNKNS